MHSIRNRLTFLVVSLVIVVVLYLGPYRARDNATRSGT
jgi:hypothetical protein